MKLYLLLLLFNIGADNFPNLVPVLYEHKQKLLINARYCSHLGVSLDAIIIFKTYLDILFLLCTISLLLSVHNTRAS